MPWKSRFLSVLRSAFRIVKSGRTSPFGESGLSKQAWQCGPGSGVPFSVLGQACLLLPTQHSAGDSSTRGLRRGRRKLRAAALTSQIPALLIHHQNCSVSSCLPGTVLCTIFSLCLSDRAVAWRAPSWGRELAPFSLCLPTRHWQWGLPCWKVGTQTFWVSLCSPGISEI